MKFNGKEITELLAVNRRNFIKLIVGGAVGTGLSPLPWKLMDDVAIFSENLPWVPVPPVGEFLQVKSLCKLCPGGCGIEVRKVDERAVKIEGRTDYPVNPGGVCPLGMGGLQLLYNEGNRFTGPMKRIGPRGSGKFLPVTWDEALDTLKGRISDLRKRGNIGSLVAVDGNPGDSTLSTLIERLMGALGSPNYMRVPSAEDTSRMAGSLIMGKSGPITYDLENSDYVLSFGSGLLEGWGSPGRVINAWGLWKSSPQKKKVRIVQIESRASNTASKADQWVAVRPGTEAALALGVAHVMIREGLYDRDFVDNRSFGFLDWRDTGDRVRKGFRTMVLEGYSPERVEGITGVKVKEISSLAKDFARARAPVALCGKGKGYLNGSLYEFMAVYGLNGLAGSINRSGGLIVQEPLPLAPLPDIERDFIAEAGIKEPRIDQAGSNRYPFTHSLLNNLSDIILKETGPSPVDTLLVFSSNPAFTLPDGGAFRRALEKVPFVVSFSPYHDETAYMADLVLPDHTYLEKVDDITWPRGLQYPLYGLTSPLVEPLYGTRNSGDVIIQLARRFGGSVGNSFPWEDYEEVLKTRVRGLFESGGGLTSYDDSRPAWEPMTMMGGANPGYTTFEEMWKKIRTGGFWYRPVPPFQNRDMFFNTPSGRFEFVCRQIELAADGVGPRYLGIEAKGDEAFMPHYEPPESEDEGRFPLRMIPYEMINLSSGWLPNPPYLNKTLFADQLLKDDSFVEINPRTAGKYGLREGEIVFLESPKGKVRVRVHIFQGAMSGMVYMPLGLGHWAYDDFQRGKGVNPNDIIAGGKDPLSGHPVWWDSPVRIVKA